MDPGTASPIAPVDDVKAAKSPTKVLPLTPSVLLRHNAGFPTTPSGHSVTSSVAEDPERLRHHLITLAQEKTQLIRSLEQVVGMYGELKTQYGNLHAVHERLQAEHEAIVRSASAPVGLDVSSASLNGDGASAAGGVDDEKELTEEEKLVLQVKELKRQLQVSINSKISETKRGQVERHVLEADKERLQAEMRRMQRRIEAQDTALETLQNERKALLHYAQNLEADAARMRVAAEESGALKSSTEHLQAQLRQAAEQIEELKETLYKTQHELEWRTSAPGDDPHDYETFAMKAEQELHLTKMKLMKATSVARHVHAAKATKAEDDLRRVTTLWWEMATLVGVDLKRLHPDINPRAHEAVLAVSDGGDLAKVLFRKVKHRLTPFLEAIQAHGNPTGASAATAAGEAASGAGAGGSTLALSGAATVDTVGPNAGGGAAAAGSAGAAAGDGSEVGGGGGDGGGAVDSGDESESEVARRRLVSRLADTFVTVAIRSCVNNLVSGDRSIGKRT